MSTFDNNQEIKPSAGQLKLALVLPILLLVLYGSFVIVDAGHVGVVKRLGAVKPEFLTEGFHFKLPLVDVVEPVDIRLTRIETKAASSSRDLQTVQTQVTVQFSLNGAVAPKTYQKIGSRRAIASILVFPAIQESVKAITAQYTAEQLITQRAEVKGKIQEAIKNFIDNTLKEKEVVGALQIANVAITDFDFSKEFNNAIELKVRAEQEALQAKNEKLRRVTQAEAAAAEKKLAADAFAYKISVESKARAQAISREAEALKGNPELISLRSVEKWDGTLPRFSGGDSVPFIDINKVTDSRSK